MDLQIKKKYWLLGRNSQQTIENKTLINESVIRPL